MSTQKTAYRLAMDAHAFGSGPELERRIRAELESFKDHGRDVGRMQLAHAVRGWIDVQRGSRLEDDPALEVLDDLEELLDGVA